MTSHARRYLNWPMWLECALGPATAIALMHKLGVTHPPAAGVSLMLLSSPQIANWRYIWTPLLAGNATCIVLAIAINNLSSRRQYPIYW